MKRLLLSSFLFGVFVLSACSSGVNDVKPVEANNIKEVCLKGSIRKAPDEIIEALTKSLKQKHIAARVVKKDDGCNHILHFSVKGNSKIIARARLDLRDSNNLSLGSISYKHRGDEADRVKQVGLQGQTDLMINELFKNN
ncbi:hypothetical protein [Haemophilus parainfluenzae]|jgi:putative lipoprotein|uniref:Uncharacterized protein n=1 Tax=Haemophilus parainfluenzae TaxID=729 RepID=A0AB36E9Q1_HAEPA|nr:hypothetical protein [Haemophilus parainfluenzae]MDU5697148.1 hypothetical protein [Haemophilus parainfluenzae]OBY52174.1 hypothetical protein BBB48_03345 [Haemophilus parainfluenzae]RDE76521.1 hypothetical protein DPV94_05545 [Haemophilus parainfluenzae]